jgi:hypothetical protein
MSISICERSSWTTASWPYLGSKHECRLAIFRLCVNGDIRLREKQLYDCVVANLGSHYECRPTIFRLCVNGDIDLREKQLDDCVVAILGSHS